MRFQHFILMALALSLSACISTNAQVAVNTHKGTIDGSFTGSGEYGSVTVTAGNGGKDDSDGDTGNSQPTHSIDKDTKKSTYLKGVQLVSERKTGRALSQMYYRADLTLNQLILDGEAIELLPQNSRKNNHSDKNDKIFTYAENQFHGKALSKIISGDGYASRFGLLKQASRLTAFSQGEASERLPNGRASYRGDYVGYDHVDDIVAQGRINASVDFERKRITLTASNDSAGNAGATLSGRLSGNRFSLGAQNITGKGQFYGHLGRELGGTYHRQGVYSAAFAAKKQ